MNREARVWLKIVCNYLILGKYVTDVTRDRVCLVNALMQDVEINVGAIIKPSMKNGKGSSWL